MAYYKAALICLRDSRSKRGRNIVTKKFIDAVKVVNRDMPMFDASLTTASSSIASQTTDLYSNELLKKHSLTRHGVAKEVKGDGNCLFNAVSVALVGKKYSNFLF